MTDMQRQSLKARPSVPSSDPEVPRIADVGRRGFSLVELLAVVVIILVLLSLLMPILKNAKLNGQRTVCLSNLGVLGKGFVQYPMANDGALMTTLPGGNASDWVRGGAGTQVIRDGALWPYVRELRVYRCPAHPFQSFDRHFSWNDMINGWEYKDGSGNPMRWTKISQVTLPTKTMALLDDIDPRGAGWLVGNWLLSLGSPYRYVDPVSAWHNQGMNLNFMDGHAEYWKWQDSRTWGMVTESSLNNMSAFHHYDAGSVDWLRLRRAVNPGSALYPPP